MAAPSFPSAFMNNQAVVERYGGGPAADCLQFLIGQKATLCQHQFQGGGNVQPAVVLAGMTNAVTPAAGLVKPLEDFMKVIAPTYMRDARTGTFTRANLLRLPAEVLTSLHSQYRGPPLTAEALEKQVLTRLGTIEGAQSLVTYQPGRANQPPQPVQPTAPIASSSASSSSSIASKQLREAQLELAVLQVKLDDAVFKQQQAEGRVEEAEMEQQALAEGHKQLLQGLLPLFEQQLFADPVAMTSSGQQQRQQQQPVADPSGASTSQPPSHVTRSVTRAAASAPATAGGQDTATDTTVTDAPSVAVPDDAASAQGASAELREEWDAFCSNPYVLARVQHCADELLQEPAVDHLLRRHLPHLPLAWDREAAAAALRRMYSYQSFQIRQDLRDHDDHLQQLHATLIKRATEEQVVRSRHESRQQQVQRLEQHQADLAHRTGLHTVMVSAGVPTFEAYMHPLHPELLVNPGALVVLLLFELVRVRCAYMPGANTLRYSAPVQQYAKESLAQYGQTFKDAAETRGQEDSPALHLSLYLAGLSDTSLREGCLRRFMKDPTRAPTTLEATIRMVETMANGELTVLGQMAEVGGAEAQRRFRDKQLHVCPTAVMVEAAGKSSGRAAPPVRVMGEMSPAWVVSMFPSAKGSEQALLDSPCVIHTAFGGVVPHKLADCSFAKKLAQMPIAQAKQQLIEFQANRSARNLPAVSVAEWEEQDTAAADAAAYAACSSSTASMPHAHAIMPSAAPVYDEDPDNVIVAYMALNTLTAGAHGIPEAVAAAALGTGDQRYTRSPAVQQAYDAASSTAPVPTGPLPAPAVSAPCSHCNRLQGHGQGLCFAQHPDCAPPFYKGPLVSDGPMAEKTFLQRVRECRPHSRYKQALAQGLIMQRSPSSSSRPPGVRPPPSRLLQRPANTVRFAAAATADGCAATLYDEGWDEDGMGDGDLVGVAGMAAQPVGFPVIDAAEHASSTQPKPGNQPLLVDGAAINGQLQQALDNADASQQLYAVTQGVQTLVAACQQADARLTAQSHRLDTFENLLSAHWRVPFPLPSDGPSGPLAQTAVMAAGRHEVANGDGAQIEAGGGADASAPRAAACGAPPMQEVPEATPEELPALPPSDPTGMQAWMQQQLSLALHRHDGPFIMDQPRYPDQKRGLLIVTPAGAPVTGLDIRLDSGCTIDIITQHAAESSGIPWFTATSDLGIKLANGGRAPLLGVTATFQVVVQHGTEQQLTTKVRALVLASDDGGQPGYDLLLGKAWMANHKVDLQLARQRVMYVSDANCRAFMLLKTRLRSQEHAAMASSLFVGDAMVAALDMPLRHHLSQGAESPNLSSTVATVMVSADALSGSSQAPTVATVMVSTDALSASPPAPNPTRVANGTIPVELLPNTRRALAPTANDRAQWHLRQFNPLQDLAPEAQVPSDPADLREDPKYGWHYGPNLTALEQQQMRAVLEENLGAFAFTPEDLVGYTGDTGEFHGVELQLTPGVDRVYEAERRYSQQHMSIQDGKCEELLRLGWIEEVPTTTPFASNSTCPAKKDAEGNWTEERFCIDFRPLNSVTIPDAYKMPLPEDLFNALGNPSHLTKLDLRSGFHQLPMHAKSVPLTSFWWRRKLYAYKRMPFGLRNATAVFQRVVDRELEKAGLSHCAKVFVDDLIIHSDSFEEHLQHVAAVLACLQRAGLRVHPRKSSFRNH